MNDFVINAHKKKLEKQKQILADRPFDLLTLSLELHYRPLEIVVVPLRLALNKIKRTTCIAHWANQYWNTYGTGIDQSVAAAQHGMKATFHLDHEGTVTEYHRTMFPHKECSLCGMYRNASLNQETMGPCYDYNLVRFYPTVFAAHDADVDVEDAAKLHPSILALRASAAARRR